MSLTKELFALNLAKNLQQRQPPKYFTKNQRLPSIHGIKLRVITVIKWFVKIRNSDGQAFTVQRKSFKGFNQSIRSRILLR